MRNGASVRLQYLVLAALSATAFGCTAALVLRRSNAFEPYFGPVQPLFVVAVVIIVAFVSLRVLRSRGGFEILSGRKTARGVALSAVLASLFAAAVILADFWIVFPRDMNVPLPEALLFYPAIAYVVETVFHALPLSMLLALFGRYLQAPRADALIWGCIVAVSCLEPALQVRIGSATGELTPADLYVGGHVFAINLLQLYVFRRYDFLSMLAFRLVYYAYWHLIWGTLRLQVLF